VKRILNVAFSNSYVIGEYVFVIGGRRCPASGPSTRCSDNGDDSTASRRLIAESGDRRSLASWAYGTLYRRPRWQSVETISADPLKGKSVVNRRELNQRYQFTGFFLVLGKPNS
jgi:hypothetical protein